MALRFLWPVLFLATVGRCDTISRTAIASQRTLTIPTTAPADRQVIDGSYQSYSIEISSMVDFAGNRSHPNKFSSQMLSNLYHASGEHSIIRAGGTTGNRAVWIQNQTQPIIAKFSASSPDQPNSLSIGPSFMESFHTFPKDIKYIFGLNFGDGVTGLAQTLLEAKGSFSSLGKNLFAYEIGNEVDGWPGGSRRPANYTVQSYVDQWTQYADAISTQVFGSEDALLEPRFQAAAFEAPRHVGNDSFWNAESIIHDGILTTGKVRTIAEHDYVGAACAGASPATLQGNLLTHTRMTSLMYYHDYLSNVTHAAGGTYVLGETNSISCQGKSEISDVFGAALWAIDYALYVATLHVSRIFFHTGTNYRYSAWQPITTSSMPLGVKPLYYGNLVTSNALSGGHKQVNILLNETYVTAYGIYEARGELDKVVIINLGMWNSTQDW